MKTHRIEVIAGRILLLIITTVVAFGALEALSRKLKPDASRSRFERWYPVDVYRRPRPYVMFSGTPGGSGLNEAGYRGPVAAMPKPPGEYRVCMLGGSTLVEGTPQIGRLVERLFQMEGMSRVKVYNFGVVSSVSGQELAKIVFELSDLQPDLIVMYNGANDLYQPLYWDPRPGYPFNYIAMENNPIVDRSVSDYPTLTMLAYGSNILRVFLNAHFMRTFIPLERTRASVGFRSEAWKDQIVSTYLKNVVRARTVSKSFGADFVAFFQPIAAYKDSRTKEEEAFFDAKEAELLQDMRARVTDGMLRIQGAQKDEQPTIVDLSLLFKDSQEWLFTDLIHTTQEAKPVIAKAIFGQLRERVANQ
jgi:lysophospholipase L1-like esterase